MPLKNFVKLSDEQKQDQRQIQLEVIATTIKYISATTNLQIRLQSLFSIIQKKTIRYMVFGFNKLKQFMPFKLDSKYFSHQIIKYRQCKVLAQKLNNVRNVLKKACKVIEIKIFCIKLTVLQKLKFKYFIQVQQKITKYQENVSQFKYKTKHRFKEYLVTSSLQKQKKHLYIPNHNPIKVKNIQIDSHLLQNQTVEQRPTFYKKSYNTDISNKKIAIDKLQKNKKDNTRNFKSFKKARRVMTQVSVDTFFNKNNFQVQSLEPLLQAKKHQIVYLKGRLFSICKIFQQFKHQIQNISVREK